MLENLASKNAVIDKDCIGAKTQPEGIPKTQAISICTLVR